MSGKRYALARPVTRKELVSYNVDRVKTDDQILHSWQQTLREPQFSKIDYLIQVVSIILFEVFSLEYTLFGFLVLFMYSFYFFILVLLHVSVTLFGIYPFIRKSLRYKRGYR